MKKVVVFNTKTWEEIDTDAKAKKAHAIKLNLKNHQTGVQVDSKVYLGSWFTLLGVAQIQPRAALKWWI